MGSPILCDGKKGVHDRGGPSRPGDTQPGDVPKERPGPHGRTGHADHELPPDGCWPGPGSPGGGATCRDEIRPGVCLRPGSSLGHRQGNRGSQPLPGDFEYNSALSNAQYTVEEGVEDRDLLTWRIPGGDSIFDLRQSVRACLHLVQVEALALKEEKPTILLVSHYVWMHELYNVLAEISEALGNEKKEKKAKLPNTGLDRYVLTTQVQEDRKPELEQVVFDLISCGRHLEAIST